MQNNIEPEVQLVILDAIDAFMLGMRGIQSAWESDIRIYETLPEIKSSKEPRQMPRVVGQEMFLEAIDKAGYKLVKKD